MHTHGIFEFPLLKHPLNRQHLPIPIRENFPRPKRTYGLPFKGKLGEMFLTKAIFHDFDLLLLFFFLCQEEKGFCGFFGYPFPAGGEDGVEGVDAGVGCELIEVGIQVDHFRGDF